MFHHYVHQFVACSLLAVVVVHVSYGCAEEPAGQPREKATSPGEEGWGKAVGGVRLRLRTTNPTVEVKGVVHLFLELQNTDITKGVYIINPMCMPDIEPVGKSRYPTDHGWNMIITAELVSKRPHSKEAYILSESLFDGREFRKTKRNRGASLLPVESGMRFDVDALASPTQRSGFTPKPDEHGNYRGEYLMESIFEKRVPGTYRLQAIYRVDMNTLGVKEQSQPEMIDKGNPAEKKRVNVWTGEIKSLPLLVEVTEDEKDNAGEDPAKETAPRRIPESYKEDK